MSEQLALQPMTAEQIRILHILEGHRGKAHAIRVKDLAAQSEIPERQARDLVNALILVFQIRIGSSYSGTPGYYIIQTAEEAEGTYQVLYNHALSILHRAAIIKRISFRDLVGQMRLGEK